MHYKRFLAAVCVLSGQLLAEGPYVDANRGVYYAPSDIGLAVSNGSFTRRGPNANPAFLGADSCSEALLAYAGLYGNALSSSMFSFVAGLRGHGALSVSLDYLYIPDILYTADWETDAAGDPIVPPASQYEYRTASEIFLHAGYGREWVLRRAALGAGVAANVLRRRLLDWTGYGIGLDLGAGVRFTRTGIRLGLLAQNITTTYMNWSKDYDEQAQPHLRLDIGWRRDFPYIYGALQFTYSSLDLLANQGANATSKVGGADNLADKPEHLTLEDPEFLLYGNYGLEYTIAKVVSLRFGVENLDRIAFGGGLLLLHETLAIDFAYITHALSGSYAASLAYRWR